MYIYIYIYIYKYNVYRPYQILAAYIYSSLVNSHTVPVHISKQTHLLSCLRS